MRRSMFVVVAAALLAVPAGAGLAAEQTAGPSTPRVIGPRTTSNQAPVYRFSASERGVPAAAIYFRCAVDSTHLHACPRRYHAQLAEGSHVLRVRAFDPKGRKSPLARLGITITSPIAPGAQVVATIQMPDWADPEWIAADASNVWVHTPDHVVRVSPASNAIAAAIPTPSIKYGYMASGAGAVWQANFDDDSLLRINPSTNAVAATIRLGDDAAPEGVAIAEGSVWVAEHHQGAVVRIDPATNAVVATISVGPTGQDGPLEMTAGGTGLWVNVPSDNRVVHIDTSTNSVVGFVGESGQPIVDGTSVWIETGSGLDRIDPATAQVVAHIATSAPNAWGAAGLGSVWVTTSAGLARVDEGSNQLVGLLPNVPKGDLAVGAGSVWLAGYGDAKLLRLQPTG
jgi:virginiamycin B lyase